MNTNLYGYGMVGKAFCDLLINAHSVNVIDPKHKDKFDENFVPECAIICVPTPTLESGECDISAIIECLYDINANLPVLIKSTLSLEGWKVIKEKFPKHSINFSPEFLRAASASTDLKQMDTMYLSEERAQWWARYFNPLWHNMKFIVGRAEELILIKYFRNTFLATKVSFFNQMYDLCEAVGVDFIEVSAGVAQDQRIGWSHTDVTETRGFGGACFPKDSLALLTTAENNNVELSVLKEACRYNSKIRKNYH